ncbi:MULTISPECIES: hypothetical protein [unclassified Clostridium]|uniref:hypothetical protein n=1 Tax=unclassified Clostridium TaxID=2614128 RepID=UPI0013EE613A|nr:MULTISPECIES: hypothetical protein [unclassified Clostridium]MBZ9693339.1 hypothetical protein [Clostridium sp. M14]
MSNENIYDGCGVISSELLKKNFQGFEQGNVVNLKEGVICKTDIFQFANNKSKQCKKYTPKGIYELSICKCKPIEKK